MEAERSESVVSTADEGTEEEEDVEEGEEIIGLVIISADTVIDLAREEEDKAQSSSARDLSKSKGAVVDEVSEEEVEEGEGKDEGRPKGR